VPLVLAGEADPAPEEAALTAVVGELVEGADFEVDGERRGVSFTDGGLAKVEQTLGVSDLYAPERFELLTAANVALHARALVERDVHYIIVDGQIQLINDARGRVADRQRWPDGLHAAVERKEGLVVTRQSEVLDQILVESVARSYLSLTGMSGTAREAAERLHDDLQLRTGMVPTHRRCVRVDEPDRLFSTIVLRDESAAEFVCAAHQVGRPVLVGTANVGESERFAQLLAEQGVTASVLNARNDAQEAEVIARAGRFGAVTVSTQMAGRGVDIQLDQQARDAGGLLVVGLSRYESTRLDRQLRGRSGRQGDPGTSVFFTSLEDSVISKHLEINEPPTGVGADGRITDPKFWYVYDHAQRVAEGKLLQLHRTTRKYNSIVDAHSEIFLKTRERILVDYAAFDEYLDQMWPGAPERSVRWREGSDRMLAVEVVLHQLDRVWSEHVNLTTATLEGIHLRVLGRLNPLDEFNRVAIQDFLTLGARARDAVREILDAAPANADSLADLGLRRPSSTWTYMVTDNPFMSQADHILAFIAKKTRGEKLPLITYK
jgi:preprotein translocase subunit SecA